MPNWDDEVTESEALPEGWIIEIIDDTFGCLMLGFVNGDDARAAYNALKGAFVLGEGGFLTLQNRDENDNWIVMDKTILE